MPTQVRIIPFNTIISIVIVIFYCTIWVYILKQATHTLTLVCSYSTIFSSATYIPYILCILNRSKRLSLYQSIKDPLCNADTKTAVTISTKALKRLKSTIIASTAIIPLTLWLISSFSLRCYLYFSFSPFHHTHISYPPVLIPLHNPLIILKSYRS